MLRRLISLFFMDDDVTYARRLAQAILSGEILTVPERSILISALSRGVILNAPAVWTKLISTSLVMHSVPSRVTTIHVGCPQWIHVRSRSTFEPVENRAVESRVPVRVVSCDVGGRVNVLTAPSRSVLL